MGIVFSGVTLCNFQSLCRDVPCLDLAVGQRERKSNGYTTASGSQIGYARSLTGVFRYNESCQFFCFGAGNEVSGGYIETPPAIIGISQNVLNGFLLRELVGYTFDFTVYILGLNRIFVQQNIGGGIAAQGFENHSGDSDDFSGSVDFSQFAP